jgi:tetratricopeptide (TPR) repeat protein
VWFYLWKLVWPLDLTFIYPRWTIRAADPVAWVFPVALAGLFAALWAIRQRTGRGPITALSHFVIALGPALGFINVYPMRYSFVADHFQYLASIGPFALLAGLAVGLVEPAGRIKPRVARAVTAVLLAALATLTWAHARSYESLETLCLEILREQPENWLGNNNLGNLHMQRGELETALEYFNVAHKTAPTYIETHLNLSIALMNLGRLEEAALHARRAIELRPTNTFGYVTLGEVLLREDKPGEAEGWFRQSLSMTPELPRALRGLAVSLGMLGRYDEAIVLFERALRDDPDNPTLLRNLETARQAAGR